MTCATQHRYRGTGAGRQVNAVGAAGRHLQGLLRWPNSAGRAAGSSDRSPTVVRPPARLGGLRCVCAAGRRGKRRRIAEPTEKGVCRDGAGGHESGLVLRRPDLARARFRGRRVLPAARQAALRPSAGRATAGARAPGPGGLSRDPRYWDPRYWDPRHRWDSRTGRRTPTEGARVAYWAHAEGGHAGTSGK